MNCRFFDSSAPNECLEPVETRVARKSMRNDCSHFELKVVAEFAAEEPSGSDARAEFDRLFDL